MNRDVQEGLETILNAAPVVPVMVIEDVLSARLNGIDPRRKDEVLSLLTLTFAPGAEGARLALGVALGGRLHLSNPAIGQGLQGRRASE